jgi:subtilisin family serine protease
VAARRATRTSIFVSIIAGVAACGQTGERTVVSGLPGGQKSVVSKPVDPAEVAQLRESFNLISASVRTENPEVRNSRAIARLLRQQRRPQALIVRTKPEALSLTNQQNPDTPLLAAGGIVQKRFVTIPALRVDFPDAKDDIDMQAVVTFLQNSPHVASVEPDLYIRPIALPNDTRFDELWGLKNNIGAGPDIGVTPVWGKTTGSKDVVVGVIDSGVDYDHPDLAKNIWNNPGETGLDGKGSDKRSNGIDDDANGYIDDWRGWDFVDDDNTPKDEQYHGTHVAGTIGAVGNNGQGVTGVNWKVSIAPLRFMNSQGGGFLSDAIAAIEYAVTMKFFATNNSWGTREPPDTLLEAVKKTRDAGQLFIVAAGNDGLSNDPGSMYPASYRLENMLSVAAIAAEGSLAWFSNFGRESVHVAAPGVGILSTVPGGDYRVLRGTSMAAPHVTGAAALLKAAMPSLTTSEIKRRLLAASTKSTALYDKVQSGGIINVQAALNYQSSMAAYPEVIDLPKSIRFGATLTTDVRNPFGGNLVNYRYGIGQGINPNCGLALQGAGISALGQPINHDFGGFEGFVYLCITGIDANGAEVPSPRPSQWLQVNGTPPQTPHVIYGSAAVNPSNRPTSRQILISRVKRTATSVPAPATVQARICKVDDTSAGLDLGSCMEKTATFKDKALGAGVIFTGLSRGNHVLVVKPPYGSVAPVPFTVQ